MANMFRCTLASGGALVLTVTCDYRFSGSLITCTDGTNTFTETCPSSSPYEVTFSSISIGTWTVSGEFEGVIYSEQIVISNFTLNLLAGFNYKQWVTLGGLDPTDYASLSDVFADEAAVRRLMTIHASADYLIEKVTDDVDTIDDFVANDTAMKWIGLRDYVCDGLTAITGVEAKFMASQYWERYLKDHVPVMTSNTAPYGTASVSATASSSYHAYNAFDGDDSTRWVANSGGKLALNDYLRYDAVNPICVKRIGILFNINNNPTSEDVGFKIQGSNDGNTWSDIKSFVVANNRIIPLEVDCTTNDMYYLKHRIVVSSAASGIGINGICTLQFYGRSLNVSVPVMTSNTAPYGELIASGTSSDNYPWHAFDNNKSTAFAANPSEHPYPFKIGYKFTRDIAIKQIHYIPQKSSEAASYTSHTDKFYYSNDGTNWTELASKEVTASNGKVLNIIDIANLVMAKYYAYITETATESNNWSSMGELQFYGVDYTEREFAEGSTMKYLYDHGVELETFIAQKGSSTTSVSPSWNGEELYFPLLVGTDNNRNNFSFYETSYDLTNFDLLRATFGFDFKLCFSIAIFSSAQSSGTYGTNEANISPTSITSPNTDLALDISAINQTKYIDVGVMYVNGRSGSIKELWLE